MTTTVTSRAIVLALALAFLFPAVSATVVMAPQAAAQPADLERDADGDRRIYTAVTGGNLDPNLGDFIVLTSADCDLVGCPRDLWFRFLDGPADVPTIGDASRYAEHMRGRVDACAAGETAPDCARPRETTPGFHDIPLAATAADETLAITDGRYVVYASGPVNGPYDVYRFDVRNPEAGSLLVAGSEKDERPFGVRGDKVGVRVTESDGSVTLRILDVELVEGDHPDLWLDNVAPTASAVLASSGAVWADNEEMWYRPTAVAKWFPLHGEPYTYSDLAVAGDTVVFVRSNVCTPPASDCNTHVSPPQRSDIRRSLVTGDQATAQNVSVSTAAVSTLHKRAHSPVAFGAGPLVAFKVLDQTATPVESILATEAPTNQPCTWGQQQPGTVSRPLFLRNYLVQLDFRATGTANCPVSNAGSNVAVYAMVCTTGTGASTTRC